jgi:(1->4)-alpha-D-glucan 1-alpha-D-glucosylmutase
MAKGLEDTTFYIYNRLLSLNEVGGDPRQFGYTVDTFHRRNLHRLIRSPHGLSATATHDTKRGEDTRARLNVLSEIPRDWREAVSRWSRLNRKHRVPYDDDTVPDRNEEYFLYQTLVGAWPVEQSGSLGVWESGSQDCRSVSLRLPDSQTPRLPDCFVGRIQAYMQKAMHEAKVHTSWINPNPRFDQAVHQFVAAILDEKRSPRFLKDFRDFQARVSHWGLFNALSQALLKVASPGVPDIYQGTELWDFSLVDPDNRRPVDYDLRRRLLDELRAVPEEGRVNLCRELTENKEDGRIKLYLLWRALCCRREHPGLFTTGEYLPAHADGERDGNLCAFARRERSSLGTVEPASPAGGARSSSGERASLAGAGSSSVERASPAGRWALAVVPRLLTRLLGPGELPLGRAAWKDALLLVPGIGRNQPCRNVFTGEVLTTASLEGQACLPLAQVFAHFPVALFLAPG